MSIVEIKSATTMVGVKSGKNNRGQLFTNFAAPLLHDYKRDTIGGHITVDGTKVDGLRNGATKIYLLKNDYELVGEDAMLDFGNDTNADSRTDTEICAELQETFEILADISGAVADGVVKGLIVSGPPGIGKSHTVETVLHENLGVPASLLGVQPKYEIISGHMSPISLYCTMYRLSEPGSVLVMDDADSVLFDEESLNLLKAALDTKKVRRIHWGTNSYILEKEGVPSNFEFKGSVIFITNIKFDECKSKLAPHLAALMSRAHYLDLRIDTLREQLIHILNIATTTDMLNSYNFSRQDVNEIVDYVKTNVKKLTKVDLRTIIKCADLKAAMPNTWTKMADRSLCKNRKG